MISAMFAPQESKETKKSDDTKETIATEHSKIIYRHARQPIINAAYSSNIEERGNAERLSSNSTDLLRCINCTLEITETMKLPVYENGNLKEPDYVRIPLGHDMALNTFELSDFCGCCAPCALGWMNRHPSFGKNFTPDVFHKMMKFRHGVQEPTIPAPSYACLSLFTQWSLLPSEESLLTNNPNKIVDTIGNQTNKTEDKRDDSDANNLSDNKDGKDMNRKEKTNKKKRNESNKNEKASYKNAGLSVQSFYRLLASNEIIASIVMEPFFVPPYPDEHLAIEKRKEGFLCSMYTDGLPDKIMFTDFKHLRRQHLEANPDSDTETDYATGAIHSVSNEMTEHQKQKKTGLKAMKTKE